MNGMKRKLGAMGPLDAAAVKSLTDLPFVFSFLDTARLDPAAWILEVPAIQDAGSRLDALLLAMRHGPIGPPCQPWS